MHSTFSLPADYALARRIDLQKDKRLFLRVNGLSLAIAALVAALGVWLGPPLGAWFAASTLSDWLLTAGLLCAYIPAHEAVHGVFIRLYSGKWGKFGFTGAYAYAGSDAYFAKIPYAVIALSPVVLWGAVFALVCACAPTLFWPFQLLQLFNLSGAAGDFYVSYLLFRLPASVLIHDDGTSMAFYTRT